MEILTSRRRRRRWWRWRRSDGEVEMMRKKVLVAEVEKGGEVEE